jgi:hypothetical protein
MLYFLITAAVANAQSASLGEGLSPLAEQQSCRLALSTAGAVHYRGPYSRGYDARSEHVHAERAAIDILSDTGGCVYTLLVEPEGGASHLTSGSDTLDFSVRAFGSARSGIVETVEFNGTTRGGGRLGATQQIELMIPPGQNIQAGVYRGFVKASLYRDLDGLLELSDQQSLEVIAEVPPRVSASFGSDPGANQTRQSIDFGVLGPALSERLNFAVNANTGYEIRFQSRNESTLLHEHENIRIGYQVWLDGQSVTMDQIASTTAQSSANSPSHHNLEFRIPEESVSGVAGIYSDELTVVITAN